MVKLYHKMRKIDITYVMFCDFFVEVLGGTLWIIDKRKALLEKGQTSHAAICIFIHFHLIFFKKYV